MLPGCDRLAFVAREKLFSVTQKDFDFTAQRGSGPGGQNRNKVDSAVRCVHPPSGAVGFAQEERSQLLNKRMAFKRCTSTSEFKRWLKVESARRSGAEAAAKDAIDRRVNAAMRPEDLMVEVGDGENWVPADPAARYLR